MDRGAYFDTISKKYYIVDEGKILRVSRTEMIDALPDGVLDISKGAIPPGPETPGEVPESEKGEGNDPPEEKKEEKDD